MTWTNWSGSVTAVPREKLYPTSLDDLVALVRHARNEKRRLRVVGAGHSFTAVAQSNDILVSLDQFQGIEQIDRDNLRVTVKAGTRLKTLGETLHQHGLAQENLGDIDEQSIAGAVSTGTHGTGAALQTIAAQIEGLTLVTGTGEVVEYTAEETPDLLNAARISLGLLGIVAKVTLRVVPAYKLHQVSHQATLDEVLPKLDALKQNNRHFEFFWFPYSPYVLQKRYNVVGADTAVSERNFGTWFNETVMENGAFWALSELSRALPSQAARVSQLCGKLVGAVDVVNHSHKIFATPRHVKFQEMEYNIPAVHFEACLREIDEAIRREKFNVHFPVECRFVAADDIWLSPAYQRDSAYLAVHMYKGMPHEAYFAAMERIFHKYEGRPHWGKMHNLSHADVLAKYPQAPAFLRLRQELDPQGIFLNDYLAGLFGVEKLN